MDEPSLGLAPLIVQSIFGIIREINRRGITVLLNEQNANMALQTADKAYVLETAEGSTMEGTGAEASRSTSRSRRLISGRAKPNKIKALSG